MPKEIKSASGSESLPEENAEQQIPSSEGENSHKKSAEQLLKEFQAEAKRKGDTIDELKSQLAELKADKEERLAELEDKEAPSAREKKEMKSLEAQIANIESDERSKAWLELNKRVSSKVFSEGWSALDKEYARDLIDDLAEKEEMDFDKFAKEFKPFLKRHERERATRAVKLAYKDMLKEREVAQKLKEYEETKSKLTPREVNNRAPSPSDKKEHMEQAKKSGNYQGLLKQIADAQDEAIHRRSR